MTEPVSFLLPIRVPGDFDSLRGPHNEASTSAQRRLVLTMEQAAEQLGIGRSTIYELVRSGQLESISIGRLRRIPTEALIEFVDRLRGVA